MGMAPGELKIFFKKLLRNSKEYWDTITYIHTIFCVHIHIYKSFCRNRANFSIFYVY